MQELLIIEEGVLVRKHRGVRVRHISDVVVQEPGVEVMRVVNEVGCCENSTRAQKESKEQRIRKGKTNEEGIVTGGSREEGRGRAATTRWE